jgi:hypothetical protein
LAPDVVEQNRCRKPKQNTKSIKFFSSSCSAD